MTKTIIHRIVHTYGSIVVEQETGRTEDAFGPDFEVVTRSLPDQFLVRADNGAPFGRSLYCIRATSDTAIDAATVEAARIDASLARIGMESK